jgi:hypothetical protein
MKRLTAMALPLAFAATLTLSFTTSAHAGQFTMGLSQTARLIRSKVRGWNGILLLYSHGYVVHGTPNPAQDVGDPATRAFLLANGYALAESSYATTDWAIHANARSRCEIQLHESRLQPGP